MNTAFVSSKQIIAKMYRDLRLADSEYVSYMIEWMGEAIDLIGVYPSRETAVEILDVEMHRAELPPFSSISQVAVKQGESLCPLSYNASTFPSHLHDIECPNKSSNYSQGYIINSGYIETTFEQGQVYVSFKRFPLDEDGFPRIPDNQSFREALLWFIQMKMSLGGWKHPAGLRYPDIEDRWLKYCTQARNALAMPDMVQMEKFKEKWVSLIPNMHRASQMYDDLCRQYPSYISAEGIHTPAFHTPGPFEGSPSPSP